MDPQLTDEGEPYAPVRYNQLIKEKYLISKNSNVSYAELDKITPSERMQLLMLVTEELKRSKELYEKAKNASN